jgi:hypothetical protein
LSFKFLQDHLLTPPPPRGALNWRNGLHDVAELDGATMICHTNSKTKVYLLVLNISNYYEVA